MSSPLTNWKTHNKSIQILEAAEKGGYGVIAAIAYNIEHILGLVQAAERARSPLIIQFFPWAVTYSSGLLVRAAADAVSRTTSVPIALHMDHAQDEALILEAADTLPFDSIMVDMSHYEKAENLAKTKALVAYCAQKGIATEAEPGRIEGGEDGVMDTEGLEGSKTTPEEVREFIATGVDVLAPAFGNMHGEYWGATGPQLDFERQVTKPIFRNCPQGIILLVCLFNPGLTDIMATERLEQIRRNINGKVRIALHGTNGFEPELLRKCVEAGVSKINVNRMVLDDYNDHLKVNAHKVPLTKLMEEGTEKVASLTMKWMEICGSAGKA